MKGDTGQFGRFTSKDPTGVDGVFSTTGFGDGCYRVFAKLTDYGPDGGERVDEIRIRFDITVGYEKEGEDMHDISVVDQWKELTGKDER